MCILWEDCVIFIDSSVFDGKQANLLSVDVSSNSYPHPHTVHVLLANGHNLSFPPNFNCPVDNVMHE